MCVHFVRARVYVFSSTDGSVEAKIRGRSHCYHSFIYPHIFILYGYIHQILGSHTGVVGQGQRGEERVCRQNWVRVGWVRDREERRECAERTGYGCRGSETE